MAASLALTCKALPGNQGMYKCKDPDGDEYTGPIAASDTTVKVSYGSSHRGGMLDCSGPSVGAKGTAVVAGYKCTSVDTRDVALADQRGITFAPNKMAVYDATRNGNSLSVDGGRIKVTWSDSA